MGDCIQSTPPADDGVFKCAILRLDRIGREAVAVAEALKGRRASNSLSPTSKVLEGFVSEAIEEAARSAFVEALGGVETDRGRETIERSGSPTR